MRKIKKMLKYVSVDILPDNEHDLIKKIGDITDNKSVDLYFYSVKYNTFKSNIPKVILELISAYELYVKNIYLNMWRNPVYYDTYRNKVSGFKYHYSIYTNFMSTDDFITEIRKICDIASKRKVLYNIYNVRGSISTPDAITAIHELVEIYLRSIRNNRIYFADTFKHSMAQINDKILNNFIGESIHPTN